MNVESLRQFFQLRRFPHVSTVTNKKQRGLEKTLEWVIGNLVLSQLSLSLTVSP